MPSSEPAPAVIRRWRFYLDGTYQGSFAAKPDETADDARTRFLAICPQLRDRLLTVEGEP